jgi:hypothetical protein
MQTDNRKAVAMTLQERDSSDPRVHTENVRNAMTELIEHLKHDIARVDEPRAQALFETTAEVLQGLVTAYDHYDSGQETAFRR